MLVDLPELREKVLVFHNRSDAGGKLADMLQVRRDSSAIILALPAGGVPVAAAIAEKLGLTLDVAVVSKLTLPWDSEAGFGAVAFDGTVCLNEQMLSWLGLTQEQVRQRLKLTADKVARRVQKLRGGRPPPDLSGKTVILVDDGIASGFTMQVAVEAVSKTAPAAVLIATPTGHRQSLDRLSLMVETIYCANVRSGCSFTVADAYRNWHDVDEAEAADILNRFGLPAGD